MSRNVIVVKNILDFYPHIIAGKELKIFDNVIDCQIQFVMSVEEESWIYSLKYESVNENISRILSGNKEFSELKIKQYIIDSFREERKDFLEGLKIIDAIAEPITEKQIALVEEKAVTNEIPSNSSKDVAIVQPDSDFDSLQDYSEENDRMECSMNSDQFSKLMSDMRVKLPGFNMLDLSISVDCIGDKKVKAVWIAQNNNGRRYIWEMSKILASSLLKNEAKEVKLIEENKGDSK